MNVRLSLLLAATLSLQAAAELPFTQVPAEFAGQFSPGKSPLVFKDGSPVKNADEWRKRRT